MWSQRFKQGENANKTLIQDDNHQDSRRLNRLREEMHHAADELVTLAQTAKPISSYTESEREFRHKKGYEAESGLTIDDIFDQFFALGSEQEFDMFIKRHTSQFLSMISVLSPHNSVEPSEDNIKLLLALRFLSRMHARNMPLAALQGKGDSIKGDMKEILIHMLIQNSMRIRAALAQQHTQGIASNSSPQSSHARAITAQLAQNSKGRSL